MPIRPPGFGNPTRMPSQTSTSSPSTGPPAPASLAALATQSGLKTYTTIGSGGDAPPASVFTSTVDKVFFSDSSENRTYDVVLPKQYRCITFLFSRPSPCHWQQQKLITFAGSVKEIVLLNWWKLWQKSIPTTQGKGYNPNISQCISERRNNLNDVIESSGLWSMDIFYREELDEYVKKLRSDRGGSLNGMGMDEIVHQVSEMIFRDQKVKMSQVRWKCRVLWWNCFMKVTA